MGTLPPLVVPFAFFLALLVAGCATQTQMSPDELKKALAHDAVVMGSVQIWGGADLLGRTEWRLGIKEVDRAGRKHSLQARRGGEEQFFALRLPPGNCSISELYQEGFSTFTGTTDIRFSAESGKKKYLGRLLIEFSNEVLSMGTVFGVKIEDARERTLEEVRSRSGADVGDVVTDLMAAQKQLGCLAARPSSFTVSMPVFPCP